MERAVPAGLAGAWVRCRSPLSSRAVCCCRWHFVSARRLYRHPRSGCIAAIEHVRYPSETIARCAAHDCAFSACGNKQPRQEFPETGRASTAAAVHRSGGIWLKSGHDQLRHARVYRISILRWLHHSTQVNIPFQKVCRRGRGYGFCGNLPGTCMP